MPQDRQQAPGAGVWSSPAGLSGLQDGLRVTGVALWKTERAGARPLALRCRRGPCTLPSGLRQAPCLPGAAPRSLPVRVPPGQADLGTLAPGLTPGCGSLGFSETRGILGQKLSPRSVSPSGGNIPPCASCSWGVAFQQRRPCTAFSRLGAGISGDQCVKSLALAAICCPVGLGLSWAGAGAGARGFLRRSHLRLPAPPPSK